MATPQEGARRTVFFLNSLFLEPRTFFVCIAMRAFRDARIAHIEKAHVFQRSIVWQRLGTCW